MITTSDFYLAAFLLAKNIPLTNVIKDNPRKAVFVFPKTDRSNELMSRFSQMKGNIEPLAFASAQKKLKHLLYLPR